jgi:hypothetical protein
LLAEDDFPVVETNTQQVAIIGEVEELLACTLFFLAGEVRQEVVTIKMYLEILAIGLVARSSFSLTLVSPAAATSVGAQSRWDMISFEMTPGLILPGQRTKEGTRNAPSQFMFFSPRNGVIAPSGQVFMWGPLSVLYNTIVLSAMPRLSILSRTSPTFLS